MRDARIGLSLYAISGIIVYGYLSASILAEANIPVKRLPSFFSSALLFSSIAVSFLIFLKITNVGSLVIIIAGFLLSLGYYIYIVYKEPLYRDFIIRQIIRLYLSRLK